MNKYQRMLAKVNQCDGCMAGIPTDENNCHAMGSRSYPDRMACQKDRYLTIACLSIEEINERIQGE